MYDYGNWAKETIHIYIYIYGFKSDWNSVHTWEGIIVIITTFLCLFDILGNV